MSEAEAASATNRRLKSGELVLLMAATRAVLDAAFDALGILAPGGGDGVDEAVLLGGGEALPAGRAEPLERAIADLVLHALRSLDPVAEVDVRQPRFRRAPDVIEDDEVPKPGARLMFRVVEAVDHRQPVPLTVGEACADQAALLPVPRGFPVLDNKAGNRGMFHHVGVIDLVHRSHAAAGMAMREVALQQVELLAGRPRAALGNHDVGVAAQAAALRVRRLELAGRDTHGDARLAFEAARP